jgi:hypothetical protein
MRISERLSICLSCNAADEQATDGSLRGFAQNPRKPLILLGKRAAQK